jgi:hypothetical protein
LGANVSTIFKGVDANAAIPLGRETASVASDKNETGEISGNLNVPNELLLVEID